MVRVASDGEDVDWEGSLFLGERWGCKVCLWVVYQLRLLGLVHGRVRVQDRLDLALLVYSGSATVNQRREKGVWPSNS